jgi:hypothetical protein
MKDLPVGSEKSLHAAETETEFRKEHTRGGGGREIRRREIVRDRIRREKDERKGMMQEEREREEKGRSADMKIIFIKTWGQIIDNKI